MGSADPPAAPPRERSRFLLAGAVVGGLLGLLFSLAVVSFADCVGEHCAGERVVGVVGHVLGGALLAEAVWLGGRGLWWVVKRLAGR